MERETTEKVQGFLHFPFHEASQLTRGAWLPLNSGVTWENLRAQPDLLPRHLHVHKTRCDPCALGVRDAWPQ